MLKHLIPRFKPNYNFKEWIAAFSFWRDDLLLYEKKFASKFNCSYGLMFSYGRVAIYSLLKVWGLRNSEIICPAYTCVVVPNAIVLSGNIPKFIDSEKRNYNMDIDLIEKSISEKTGAIIVTHLFGNPINAKKIESIVKKSELKFKKKIYIIQDCAHSFQASWESVPVTSYGDASIFGLNVSKIINSIFGGMVTTNDPKIYDKLVEFRKNEFKPPNIFSEIKRLFYFISVFFCFNPRIFSMVNLISRFGVLDSFIKYYSNKIDFPKDWDMLPKKIETRVGLIQLNKYESNIKFRRELSKFYREKLKDSKKINFNPDIPGATYSQISCKCDDKEKLIKNGLKKGIEFGEVLEYCIPYMTFYKNYKNSDYPNALKFSKETINLPLVKRKYREKIVNFLN